MDMSQERALVIGTGISGIGAARLLARKGAGVTLYDEKEDIDIEGIRGRLGIDSVEIVAGVLPEAIDRAVTLLVISPGVPVDAPIVNRYRDRGIRIIGEIELAYSCARGRLIGITGTNGKTTTTSLVGAMMRDYFGNAYVVGNIGNPYTDIAMDTDEASVTVAEISSFQLETIETFRPNVSAILNITPDHLNRHHTMECYVETKEAIARFQTGEDYCVLNYENEYTRDFGERCPSRVVFFSSERVLENGFYLVNEDIYYSRNGVSQRIMNIYDMNLVGMCNIENVMAALAIGSCMGIPFENLLKTIREFKAVEHRIEFVATKRGVDYYNDSKGTNPDAAIQGIRAMRKPTILIGGGYDKGSTYDEWIEAFDGKVKKLILIGQTRDKIAACARAHGFEDILFAESLEEVMRLCVELSVPGDAVLLSPACASWGMFPNYEVRGKLFKDFVYKIEE
ncbi:MAG: UDP-N-acetylmuramoyl-L-alanine--D-glutamate ligase [Lachnospiraceae bacterium]